eukprot:CAMPEP_0113571954 /NCGR_PEP_ID=MMETSP0015_2-20120614/25837_1 /TAXON_ID=2838 /ORGANISM="Odontella" /LENGTH=428 /DNA_ID=CAMNT_0000474955 /DNA_START=246 /DNA_END=1528 /DNA_ORIENTATION=- /assembly_acc=CAM_ASM_000160
MARRFVPLALAVLLLGNEEEGGSSSSASAFTPAARHCSIKSFGVGGVGVGRGGTARYVSELEKTDLSTSDAAASGGAPPPHGASSSSSGDILEGDILEIGNAHSSAHSHAGSSDQSHAKANLVGDVLEFEGASAASIYGRRNDNGGEQILDASTYEMSLLNTWDDPSKQRGFDWEIEKLRRNAAGLRRKDDGTWVRRDSVFDFLVNRARFTNVGSDSSLDTAPKPVGVVDTAYLFAVNVLTQLGFGPNFGMAAVPDAVIQKYEGSFFSFIRGVLGGDLQTLAGGPLFLLLAKYYQDYGPIFNLSFGPKSFLVVSDPVMARKILRESTPEQYCKGMLAEILEPIMGKGLIPADPKTWKVRRRAIVPGFHKKWLNRMVTLFADCGDRLVDDLSVRSSTAAPRGVDMEERFCSVTLDIIGRAVFNYDFGSV